MVSAHENQDTCEVSTTIMENSFADGREDAWARCGVALERKGVEDLEEDEVEEKEPEGPEGSEGSEGSVGSKEIEVVKV